MPNGSQAELQTPLAPATQPHVSQGGTGDLNLRPEEGGTVGIQETIPKGYSWPAKEALLEKGPRALSLRLLVIKLRVKLDLMARISLAETKVELLEIRGQPRLHSKTLSLK